MEEQKRITVEWDGKNGNLWAYGYGKRLSHLMFYVSGNELVIVGFDARGERHGMVFPLTGKRED